MVSGTLGPAGLAALHSGTIHVGVAFDTGGKTPAFLAPTAAVVVTAALIGYLSVRLKVVPIIGFLLAGVLIGPAQLGIIGSVDTVDAAAEVGVILLLFTIGLEFSLERLASMRTWIALGGALQVGLAVGVVAAICLAFGVGWRAAVFSGLLVALSSTAIVIKLLADSRATGSTRGRLVISLLLFQDLAVVAMVLLVPLLGGGAEGTEPPSLLDLAVALLKAIGIIVVVLVIARRVLPILLDRVARTCSPEVFLLTVLAICFGTAFLTSLAGVSVSLGAFLAGLMVSESRLSSQALGEVLPLQILFSAVFFVSVGMLLDIRFVLENWLVVLAGVAAVFGVKLLTTWLAATALRWRDRTVTAGAALGSALLLAQIGEFSFVLEIEGRAVGLSPLGFGADGSQAFIAASVLLLIATPALAAVGRALERSMDAKRSRTGSTRIVAGTQPGSADPAPGGGQVLLSGWGATTRGLAAELRARNVDLTVITLSPDGASEASADGHRVVMGDSMKQAVLEEAGLDRSHLLVIAEDEPDQARQIARVVSGLAAYDVPVLARPLGPADPKTLSDLAEAGVTRVVISDLTSRRALTHSVLSALDGAVSTDRATVQIAGAEGSRSQLDTSRLVYFRAAADSGVCSHFDAARAVVASAAGCEDCLRIGSEWVHLRLCVQCGHVGCCDSSPNRHARAHADNGDHPVVTSAEPGESWGYCFIDDLTVNSADS